MAWAGFAEHDEARTVRPVAWAGRGSEFLARAKVSWSEASEWGRGPAGLIFILLCCQDSACAGGPNRLRKEQY